MWSMPRQVLRIVAALLVVCAIGGFTLGVMGASKRGRLPGEAAGAGATDASLNGATDARPLNTDEFLTPQPPEPEKAEEEKDEEEEETPANKVAALPAPKTPAPKPLEVAPPPPEPAPAAPPPPEDPPF